MNIHTNNKRVKIFERKWILFKSPVQIDLAIKTCFDIFVAGLIAL